MASAPTHAFTAAVLNPLIFGRRRFPRWTLWAGAALAILPDADVIAFRLGIPYHHPLGHRGLTHSIVFAVVVASLLALAVPLKEVEAGRGRLAFYWFLCILSHGLLDALTNGGLGIAFFAPFDNERYFFPWRPLDVSPIGLAAFFSSWGAAVLMSELIYVWVPLSLLWLVLRKWEDRPG